MTTIRGFQLDTNHDLALSNGDFLWIDGDAATGQEIATRLLFFRGENFADTREGVPYFQEIFQKGTDPARVRALIRDTIRSVPAVVDVPTCEIVTDPATRRAVCTWTARTNSGKVIRSTDFPPLILG